MIAKIETTLAVLLAVSVIASPIITIMYFIEYLLIII